MRSTPGRHHDRQRYRRTQELNQMMIELDGIGGHANVITIGATNIEDSLDPAFMRSGRFDRKIYSFGLPDKDARKVLFERHLKKVKVEEDINFERTFPVSFNFPVPTCSPSETKRRFKRCATAERKSTKDSGSHQNRR
ncbi:MAG: AAA family ATPase [Cyanobacteriota/Melainabacteria group bacterium]